MSQLIIDLNDSPDVLRAARTMISALLGEQAHALPAEVADPPAADRTHGMPPELGAPYHYDGDAPADARIDHNGVPFDAEFCGEATEPFYTSGKREGQWKKRRGVADDEYDDWYTDRLADVLPPENDSAGFSDTEEEQFDTAAAFSDTAPEQVAEPVPQDCGAFMAWVSEQQAAGRLTQDMIGRAYVDTGINMMDLFPPHDADTVAAHVAKLHTHMTQSMAGGAV